jgi:uncharacterized membrane protein
MLDINDRLNNLEKRLLDIEIKLGLAREITAREPASHAEAPHDRPWADIEPPPGPITAAAPARATAPARKQTVEPVSATQWMAWAAGFALLLAAVYFLKLVYDVGWLTPERQLILAALAGFSLIAAGIFLARIDRDYAAYLPALGLIILYLAAYTAHLYYHLWSAQAAIASISAITILGIWLGRRFDQSVYVIVAAIGVYLSPLLMQAAPTRLLDVVIYYSAWSVLFSFCALNEGRRITYVLPMFLALTGFDLLWRTSGESAWLLAVNYQLIQFAVFASTATAFSIIHKRPLTELDGIVHGFALIYFYALEYVVLSQHAPQWAPIVGLLSAVLLFLIYLIAKAALKDTQRIGVGAVIVSAYCSIVVAHAVFFELLPHAWFAWGALLMAICVGLAFSQLQDKRSAAFRPVLIVAGLVFCGSYLILLASGDRGADILLPNAALALYAVVLYVGYYLFSRTLGGSRASPIILYAAHFAFMEWGLRAMGNGLPLSMAWAIFAVAVLIVAIASEDKLLGQSALLIFCASGLKVLLHDLAASGSLVRVFTLIVLAVSLYLGGWLYQSLVRRISSYHPDPAINRQINTIRAMRDKGMSAQQIARELAARGQPHFGEGAWSENAVSQIIRDYALGEPRTSHGISS